MRWLENYNNILFVYFLHCRGTGQNSLGSHPASVQVFLLQCFCHILWHCQRHFERVWLYCQGRRHLGKSNFALFHLPFSFTFIDTLGKTPHCICKEQLVREEDSKSKTLGMFVVFSISSSVCVSSTQISFVQHRESPFL